MQGYGTGTACSIHVVAVPLEGDMSVGNLDAEQRAKAQRCRTPEEILALAKTEGYELTDEELGQISGGVPDWMKPTCPRCGSTDIWQTRGNDIITCHNCGYEWRD